MKKKGFHMNNKIVYGAVCGLLSFSGMIFGMEVTNQKQEEKNGCLSLFVKKNGLCVIRKYTVDDSKTSTSIVSESELIHKLVKTTPIQCEIIKKVEDINFAILGPVLDKREKFLLEIQGTIGKKEHYLIDQVQVKSWPIQLDEIKNGKYGSIGKYFTSKSVVYDLQGTESHPSVLSCLDSESCVYDYSMTETLSSVALAVLVVYCLSKSPNILTCITNSLR